VNSLLRDLPAWVISLAVNLSILLVMHFIVIESYQPEEVLLVTSIADELTEQQYVFTNVAVSDSVGTDGNTGAAVPALQAATLVGERRESVERELEELLNPTPVDFTEMVDLPLENQLASLFENRGQTDKVVGGVTGAMDRITFEISMSLKERQTLVLWLFDASGSLRARRNAIADRFETIYRQMETQQQLEGLYTAAATFGERTSVITEDPVVDVSELVPQVRAIPEDRSGVERVFGAVYEMVDQLKRFRRSDGRWNKLVFIVTDERGDDVDRLEDAITLCKRYGFRVYAVGNAAVFGRQQGFVDYTDDDGYVFRDVPVDQGPESAFPERLPLANWGGDGGDPRLQRMSAGFGPYGLTRLCAETGGVFFIADENRGYQFDMAVMRDYTPDYRPLRVLDQEVRQQPAKLALVEVCGAASLSDPPIPELAFRADDDNILRQQITEAQKPLADFKYHIDKLYSILEAGEKGRSTLAAPRWRASFDLAIGRVLAARVRAYGYNVMLANMKSSPRPFEKQEDNLWRLVPSAQIDSGPSVRKSAEQAEMYLKRVIDEHPGTPWAALAERELRQPLGWEWRPGRINIEAVVAGNEAANPRLLLADELEQLNQKRQKPSEPQRRPPRL
jgi:hypothetical protein